MNVHHSRASNCATASVSNTSATIPLSYLPVDIILSILKFLPVKYILRLKCVSKEWFSLLSSPNFISIHREETSNNPLNHSFIIYSVDENTNYKMFLLKINSTEREHIFLSDPLNRTTVVGSVNGLVCLSCPPIAQMIILWNPAMHLYKAVTLLTTEIRLPDEEISMISEGFAYDSQNDDYKIIRIICLKPKVSSPGASFRSRAEVYSANLDSWKRIQIDFNFVVSSIKNDVIAKGTPYWTGVIYEANHPRKFSEVLVYYDMRNESFNHVLLPRILTYDANRVKFVEWKGNLGAIVSSSSVDTDNFVDILVYDEMAMCWKIISSHGPIGLKIERPMQCSKEGVILAEAPVEELMLYDPLTNRIKKVCDAEALELFFLQAFSYTESLVTFKGMEQVKEQDKDNYIFGREGVDVAAAADADGDVAALFSFLNFCFNSCAYIWYWFASFALRIWFSVFTF